MSEKVEGELKVFSSILMQDYIRLMTAACYIKANGKSTGAKFNIKPEIYEKMLAEPIKAPLIGLTLNYEPEKELLTVTADDEFMQLYENKIMNGVALKFSEDYKMRYASYIWIVD